ncbi:MAG: universal stress protein [Cyclobacteriaceae bacterium]|jgi:nucleotide-binding universal stress UspA family protein|nr:universal stress protein [Cyclobacteriaceae bacterium]
MKRILVPTDFSKTSIIALEVACEIAKKGGAEVIALHVVEEATAESFRVTGEVVPQNFEDRLYTMKMLEKAKKQLEKLVMDPKFSSIKLDGELRLGNAYHGMNAIITEQKVDLVVMGTQGHSRLQEMIIGSNTEKVVRHSKVPVLSVHKKPSKVNFKNIVYATSMSKNEEKFAKVVIEAQAMYNSKIHLVRVNTPGDFQRDKVAKDYMDKFAKKLGLKNYTINVYNDLTEEEGIIYFAESIKADMIAMATSGRTGFAHVLAGSIAEEVVSHAKRPVLTLVTKK